MKKQIGLLGNEVYKACYDLSQPEYQIFWCVLSQPYKNTIAQNDLSKYLQVLVINFNIPLES